MNRAIAGPRPRALRPAKLKRERNPCFSAGKKKRKKKPNKWRLNRPHGQERSLVKREMALAEVRRREGRKSCPHFAHRFCAGYSPYSAPQRGSGARRAGFNAYLAARNHSGMRREN